MFGHWHAWRRKWQKKRLKDPHYGFLFEPPAAADTYVCFDCETTGLNPRQDKIVSISAIKIQGNQVLTSESLNLLIRQPYPIAPESIVVHQIRNADLDEAVSNRLMDEREAIACFLEFIRGLPLVGYYLEFDVAMVNQVLKPWLGIQLPNEQIDVSKWYYQQRLEQLKHSIAQPNINLSFEALLAGLNIPNLGQHDAFSDALMTALIFVKLQQSRKS
jgi:DNA polymerase-3 subunit epsilon